MTSIEIIVTVFGVMMAIAIPIALITVVTLWATFKWR